ncbi:hypothetical protein [Vibrio fluvialis]|uniref:hypothetical protein n=1 Tax=Vibrio fluvialis TaxID=676 RepID=UPI00192BC907|nr:hypothetical protein [Vibrio fluvialis]EHU4932355.1 hypothetical protein [Vibrio vulnificus]EKO3839117.1 hypothetical protein [Vibrio harveyi]EIZ1457831.1 hypothetical protein [Vibrio vulnificus]EJE8569852.1 hypothetical protein [Vibrio vulnificus]EKA7349912.1 hypothetical protein [Vibrio vulnificus]
MEKYHWALVSAIIGAISGLFAAYWRTRYTIKAQDLSKRLEELCASIGKLEELSCQYWDDTNTKEKPSPHYILGYKTKISLLVNYLDEQYARFSKADTSDLLSVFFEACTGGDFESSEPKGDPKRLRKILITGERLKIALLKIRGQLY